MASLKQRNQLSMQKPREEHNYSCCELDEEEANFLRKLERGLEKYKCKLHFKCFNCAKVGHYVYKYLEKKKNEYECLKKVKKDKTKAKKKIFYTQYFSSCEGEDY